MKRIFIIVLVVFVAFAANAQRIGVKLGPNLAMVTADPKIDDSKIMFGLHGGLVVESKIIPLIHGRLEVLYSQKGFKVVRDDYDVKSTINYLEIPLLAKVKLGPAYVMAGPYFGYALSGNATGEIMSIEVDNDLFDEDVTMLRKTDFGIKGGAGFEIGIFPVHGYLELTVSYGLTNLYGGDNYDAAVDAGTMSEDDYIKNLVFGLSVGVALGK